MNGGLRVLSTLKERYYMANPGFVTETPDELFNKAEQDVVSIVILKSDTVYPPDRKYDIICFHATQATEKFLKGYILNNGNRVEKIHNLEVLLNNAMTIDKSFKNISGECILLNQYTAEIKYTNRNPVTGSDVNKALKALQKIGNFIPIKSLRDSISKKQKYQIISEIITPPLNKSSNSIDKKKKATDYDIDR
jgi:HEPN domain-containing protein